MDRLKDYIKNLLNIPFIAENQAIMDGCFTIGPYIVGSLRGDGGVQSITINSTVNLFYKNRTDAVKKGILLFKELCNEENIFCDDPDFTFENEANIWRTTMRVQEVINNE